MSDIYLGDCREVRSVLADNSIDTIITDPPYGLEFMGKGWDKGVPGVEFWKEFLAVAKPGAMLLAFGGTRTFHRMTCAIEDAGWEIRDCMMWLYGSGFPKSLDISKALDKRAGAAREIVGYKRQGPRSMFDGGKPRPATLPATLWNGYGTALKPAWEPIILAMKPLDGTFAENAEKWGVAGINVDGGRIGTTDTLSFGSRELGDGIKYGKCKPSTLGIQNPQGRWPANLLLDEDAAAMLDGQNSIKGASWTKNADTGTEKPGGTEGQPATFSSADTVEKNIGSASCCPSPSRFFYCAKASKSERNEGCEGLPEKPNNSYGEFAGTAEHGPKLDVTKSNFHPTVKPLKLMEYLCTLTKTPTGGIVLDPFAGSGTTLLAAKNTGRKYVGIEQNPEYFEIIKARLGMK